jgi:SAM-dependent methyltransferase
MWREIETAARLLKWNQLSLRGGRCSLCGTTVFVKLRNDEMAVRCVQCRASSVTISFVSVLKSLVPDLKSVHVYELSSRGPLVGFLAKEAGKLTLSEYFDDVPVGQFKGNVQCQDVQNLTFQNNTFDVCTSIEVFEHVADDARGFREVYRVMKPGGLFLFTVPNLEQYETVERAIIVNGQIRHLLPPEYHGDRLRGHHAVLCYRNYGMDILERLALAGFIKTRVIQADDPTGWGFARKVLIGYK